MSRIHVITGAGSGIGAATAEMIRAKGETVIGVDLRNSDVTADLSTVEGREAAVAGVFEASGGTVDTVIACAGISAASPATVSVNYHGVTEFVEALRPTLAQSEAPRVAVMSSMSSLQPNDPQLVQELLTGTEEKARARAEGLAADEATGAQIYASTKRALSVWVRQRSVTPDWAGAGIPLNAVAPGVVTTPMTKELMSSEESVKYLEAVVPMPLNHFQPPESIANLLIWLTSVENTHCAGQTIYCDGGADVVLRGEDAWSWADPRVNEYFAKLTSGAGQAEPADGTPEG